MQSYRKGKQSIRRGANARQSNCNIANTELVNAQSPGNLADEYSSSFNITSCAFGEHQPIQDVLGFHQLTNNATPQKHLTLDLESSLASKSQSRASSGCTFRIHNFGHLPFLPLGSGRLAIRGFVVRRFDPFATRSRGLICDMSD